MISSDEELEGLEDLENEQQMEEEEENVKPDVKTMNEEKSDSKKVTKKVIKKEPRSTPEVSIKNHSCIFIGIMSLCEKVTILNIPTENCYG